MENSYVLQLLESKFKDFHLCFCGYSECEPLHSYGPATRPNYIIHYILDGKGIYNVGEKKYRLSKGQGFLIEPEVMTFYQADRDNPWTYLWIGFGGNDAAKIIQDAGLNSRQLIFNSAEGARLKDIVFNMLKHNQATTSNLYYLQGKLYDFFSVLASDIVIEEKDVISTENAYVEEAIKYIRNNYANGITVEDIADKLIVNRSYLYTMFKNCLQMTPKEFLTKFRLSRAKEKLTLTDQSIDEIAVSCGYKSPEVFRKAFKKIIGESPSAYRERDRKSAREKVKMHLDDLDDKK